MERSIPFQNIPIVEQAAGEAPVSFHGSPEVPPPPERRHRVLQLEASRQRSKIWKARAIRPGADVPRTGPPEAFDPGTPERRLAEFFAWWQDGRYDEMAGAVARFRLTGASHPAAMVRRVFAPTRLVAFAFSEIRDEHVTRTDIVSALVLDVGGDIVYRERAWRLILADRRGLPAVIDPGEWAVFDHSLDDPRLVSR